MMNDSPNANGDTSKPSRVVINGQMSLGIAIITSIVLGAIAIFGMLVLYVAAQQGTFDWIFFGIATFVALLIWVIISVLWSALGVWMIITPNGVKTFGAFGSRSYPAQGLHAGTFETVFRPSKHGNAARPAKPVDVDQIWVRAAGGKPRMIAQGKRGAPLNSRIIQAFDQLIDVPVIALKRDMASSMSIRPDFSIFDERAP